MLFSGNNFRLTPETNQIRFAFENISIDSNAGVAEIGFSGEGNAFKFQFANGFVYSPNGKKIYTYNVNEPISISGSIDTGRYQYYIDGILVGNNISKPNYKIQKFVANTTGCDLFARPNFWMQPVNTGLTFNPAFMALAPLSGQFVNNSNARITIFDSTLFFYNSSENMLSGQITGYVPPNSTLNFSLTDLDSGRLDSVVNFSVTLRTNIGESNGVYRINRVSGMSYVSRTISPSIYDVDFDVEFFGSGLTNKFLYQNPVNQSQFLSFTALAENFSGVPQPKNLSYKIENISHTEGGTYQASYWTGVSLTATGAYATCPSAQFTGYYFVTGLDQIDTNSILLSSGCTGNIPLIFTRRGAIGTGVSGYMQVKPIRLMGVYGGQAQNFYIYNGTVITNGGTGYTLEPAITLNTGVYSSCFDVPAVSGSQAIYRPFAASGGLSALAAYMSGETQCAPFVVSGGAATGYTVTGVLVTNDGSGFNSTTYLPKVSFLRGAGDSLTSNATGVLSMKQTGLYKSTGNWTFATGASAAGMTTLSYTGLPCSGTGTLLNSQSFLTFQVRYSGLDNTEPIVLKVSVTNEDGVTVSNFITGSKTYNTDPLYLKKKNLDNYIYFAPKSELSFALSQDELDKFYSDISFSIQGGIDVGDMDF